MQTSKKDDKIQVLFYEVLDNGKINLVIVGCVTTFRQIILIFQTHHMGCRNFFKMEK